MDDNDNILIGQLERNDPALTCLTIETEDASDEGTSSNRLLSYQEALKGNSFLQELAVVNIPIPNSFLPVAVGSLHQLEFLRLENVGLTQQSLAKVQDGDWSLPKVRHLSLANNPKLGPRGCQALKPLLNAPQLCELNLENIGMGHYGAQGIEFPDKLRILNLSRNKLGIDGIWKLSLPMTTLIELDVSHNGCLDDGCMELAKSLPIHLRALNLSFNSIGTPGLAALATALQTHGCLQKLFVSNNRIEQVHELAEWLGMQNEANDPDGSWEPLSKSTLRTLDLSNNHMESSACLILAEALRNNTSLQELNLSNNCIDDEGAGGFVDILDDNSELRGLNLSGNEAISEARRRILDMLLKHRVQQLDESTSAVYTTHKHSSANTALPAVLEECTQDDATSDADSHLIQAGRRILLAAVQSKHLQCSVNESLQAYISNATECFNIRAVVSYGAFGSLYRIHDDSLPGSYFVRCQRLRGRHTRTESTFLEINALHREHSHLESIASIVASAYSNDMFSFVYHFASGKASLAETMGNQKASLTWLDRIDVLEKVASVLQYLHSYDDSGKAGNFHGDLNPQNVFIAKTGGRTDRFTIKVLDCFMCRLPTADPTRWIAGDVMYGSRGYRCPRYERGSCRYDSASDMFSFGIMAAELMTGKLQASKNNGTIAWDVYYDCILARQPLVADPAIGTPPLKHLFSTLGKIVGICLDPDAQHRPSAFTILRLLEHLDKGILLQP